MGALPADLGLLASAVDSVQRFVYVLFSVYQLALLAYILSSWVRLPMSMARFQRFLYDICEPYLRIFRRVLPSLGPIDLSPIVALIALGGIEKVVLVILDQLR